MKVVGSKHWRIEEQIREEAAADTRRRLQEAYVAGPFGDSEEEEAVPSGLALVCVSCGAEVTLVTSDDLAAMEALPDHACPNDKEDVA